MSKGIKNKITRVVLIISLTSLLLLFIFSSASILIIRNNSIETSKQLGENAAADSASALSVQSQKSLIFAVNSLSGQIEDKVSKFSLYSAQVANYITNILNNENGEYLPKDFRTSASSEEVFLQYFNTYNGGEVTDNAKLIANAAFLMENIVETNDSITSVYFAGVDKTFIVADKSLKLSADFSSDLTSASWYKLAQEKGDTIFSDIFPDKAGRGDGISCATPVYDKDNRLLGVVGVGGLLTDVSKIIDETKLDFNGFAYIVNDSRHVIMGGNDKNLDGLIEQIDEEYSMILATYEGKEVFLAFSTMPTTKWTACAVYELNSVLAESYALQAKIEKLSSDSRKAIDRTIMGTIFTFIGIVVLTGIAISAIGKSFSSKITEPILMLNNSIDEISGKNIKYKNHIRTGDEIESLGESFERMTNQISNYIDNIAAVTAEKERIGAELSIATQIQASMLPCIFPPFPDKKEFDIFAAMRPAKEVGGDFYDFFLIDDNRLAVIVADVSGKGVPAALFMVIAKTLIKNHAQMGKSTAEIFTEANAQLCENNEAGLFVTAWLGILEINSGRLLFSNAGHNPPLIKRKGGKYEYLRSKAGFVLAGMEGIKYGQFETALNQGDELFLYTDGVTEATNANNELLGEERLLKCLNKNAGGRAKSMITNVENEIASFVAGERQFDDITMLCLQINDINNIDEKNLSTTSDSEMKYIETEATMDNLEVVQSFAENELAGKNLTQKTIYQIAVIIEEIYVNIVKHAYKSEGGLMKMGCKLTNDSLILQFVDDGKMFNPLTVFADTTSNLEDRKIGGLGIHMVKKSVEKMEYSYENNKNILTLTKKL